MIRNIFVKNGNDIRSYLIHIDEERLKTVQIKMDSTSPKSDVQTGFFVDDKVLECLLAGNERIKIIEKSEVNGKIECKYSIYEAHPLSIICDEILNAPTAIELSMAINDLFNYKPQNNRDLSYLQHLIASISIIQLDLNLITNSKVPVKVKKNILKTIQDAFAKILSQYDTLEFHQDFEEAFVREIAYQEEQISEYKYTPEEIKVTRKRILNSLPNDDKLLK